MSGAGRVLMDSLAATPPGHRSALAAVGSMELTTRILDSRIDQIQQTMLKQARWQAELLIAYMAKQPVVDSLMGQLGPSRRRSSGSLALPRPPPTWWSASGSPRSWR